MIQLNEFIKEEIERVSTVSSYLWNRNWAERNAGNISVDFSDQEVEYKEAIKTADYVALDIPIKGASGMIIYITGTGLRLRDLDEPEKAGALIRIDEDSKGYHIIWGGKNKEEFKATSELSSHVRIHIAKKNDSSNHRTIIHTHPIELIALSHHPKYNKDEALFNKTLWAMIPEVRAFVPRGISLLPYTLPGSEKLGELSANALMNKDVAIWAKHGAIACGKDIQDAFDYLDVANKGATIFLKCLSSGFEPEGLTDSELNELETAFNL